MFLTVNGARIFFDVVGSQLVPDGPRMTERPSLLVLHGGPGFDHSLMRPYFDRFADTHQVIFIDHRGNGRSGGARDTWRLAQWGDDIAVFCDTLGIVKPVVLGLSFGGMVAMSYGIRHPHHPSRLVLSSTAARLNLEATYAMMAKLGGPEAATIARQFWTDPTEESRAQYMSVCMPLYNPSRDPALAETRDRAIARFEVMSDFIHGEQRTMDMVADRLATTVRTLHRRLHAESVSFTQILDDVRCNLAKEYLRSTKLSVDDISDLVGFSEAANFRHAFHRWTGSTPANFRS